MAHPFWWCSTKYWRTLRERQLLGFRQTLGIPVRGCGQGCHTDIVLRYPFRRRKGYSQKLGDLLHNHYHVIWILSGIFVSIWTSDTYFYICRIIHSSPLMSYLTGLFLLLRYMLSLLFHWMPHPFLNTRFHSLSSQPILHSTPLVISHRGSLSSFKLPPIMVDYHSVGLDHKSDTHSSTLSLVHHAPATRSF